MAWLSCYGVLSLAEAWATGYKSEHYKLGLQMAVALCLSVLPLLITQLYTSLDRGGSVFFTALTVVVVLEPNTGASFQKFILRSLAVAVSGGIGMLILFLAVGYDPYQYTSFQKQLGPWLVPGMALVGFAFMTNHQRYRHHHAFWRTALFALPSVIMPAIRSTPENYYKGAAFRMMSVWMGIVVSAIVSYVVLPVRARDLLTKKMASSLIKIGDLAVWLVGQVCVLPQAGGDARIPGATCTDATHTYTDDGLHAKLAPLMATASELTSDLADMGKLLQAASAEIYLLRRPHTFPTKQYQMLLDACHVVLGVFLSLLYALEGNEVTLQVCQQHIGDLSETGVRLSAAFTALSSLIRTPKTNKKGRWWHRKKKQKQQQQEQQQEQAAAVGSSSAAQEVAATAAVLGKEQQRRQQEAVSASAAADGKLGSGGAAVAAAVKPQSSLSSPLVDSDGEVDDPFAALAGGGDADPARQPVVALTDSELMSAQALARHMSMAISRRGTLSARMMDYDPVAFVEEGSNGSRIGDGGGGSKGAPAGDGTGGGGDHLESKNSLGLTSLGSGRRGGEERREWVLHKLRGLVDSIEALEAVAYREREAHFNQAGLPAFMLVVHSCTTLTRQCCACFTALDADRGALLHDYFQTRRAERKLASA